MEDIKDNIRSSSSILESGEFATDSIRLHDSRLELPKGDNGESFSEKIVAETHMMGRKVNAYIPYHVATKHIKKVLHDLDCTKRALSSSKDTEKILRENQETLKTAINELYGQHTKKISQWSHKVTGLKSHNIDLMREVNELIQFNLKFRREKGEEMKQLKESYNKERRRQLESLENRESDLMSQFRLHLSNAKKSLSDKIDRLQKKNDEISEQFESIVKEKDDEISGMAAQLKDSELQLTKRASEVEQLSCKVEEITAAFDLHKNESNLVVKNLKKQLGDHVQELTLQLSEKSTAFDDFKHKSTSEIEDVKKQWDLQVQELNKKVTEKTLAYNNLRHDSDLEIDGLKKQRDENIKDLTTKLDQQSHDFDSFRDESKLDMEKLLLRHGQEVESLSTKLEEKSDAFEKSKLEIERLIQMQDEQVEALTTKLQSFENERNNLQESWKQDKEQIELSYNEKIQKLEQQIFLSESEAEKHAQVIEDMKVNMEEEMKSFKAQKEKEKAKIIQASDDEKRALSEKLEELTKRTEMKIRSSLSKIEFHRNEQQRLENVADKLEKDKQVMEENMDSAKAEIRMESQEKMQLTMSERELTITELNTVKRKRKSLNDEMRKLSSTMTTGLGATSKESIPPVASDNVIPKETFIVHDTVGSQKDGQSKTSLSNEQLDLQKDIPNDHGVTTSSKPDDPTMTFIKSNQKDLEKQISQLQEEKKQLVSQREVLKKKIVHMNEENATLSEQSKGYLEELVSVQRELVDRTNTLKVKESLVESLEKESANLKEANSKLKDELTDLESNVHSSLDVDSRLEIQKYKDKLMLAEQELEYTESSNRHEIQQYKENVIKLESAVEEAQIATTKIENELALRETDFKKSIAESTKEIEELQETIKSLEKQCEDAAVNVVEDSTSEYQEKIAELEQSLQEREKLISDKEKKIKSLEKEFSSLQDELLGNGGGAQTATRGSARGVSTRGGPVRGARGATRGAVNNARAQRMMETQISTLKSRNETLNSTVSNLEKDVTDLKKAVRTAEAEAKKAKESGGMNAKDSKKLEIMKKTLDDTRAKLEKSETSVQKLEKESKELTDEVSQLKKEKKALESVAGDTASLKEQVADLSEKVKSLQLENAEAIENYNSERILRKKYYNQIEDMKGKIRVFCRARPISSSEIERGNHSVILSPDEYTLTVQTKRGPRDFTFDQVFTPDTRGGQEHIFEDVKMLIQSAADGYNVCIFAYGQTGSGKTFTMIGGGDMPGIAPRAFAEIFDLLNSNVKQFSYQVTLYMVELYNDMLLDLLDKKNNAKLDIKKDKKGMVFVTNITVKDAADTEQLMKHFDEGSKNRHVASTKMNAESSRSHLIISVVIETTNKVTGAVVRGKLSLVDLAGSERAAKTGATPEQLKEAQSINKSLSALGDVISALSSDASYVPYRNNKLTMLMQDSLGGNAKTLMFVNISPVDYNTDETIVSLTYASRVKLITNSAAKNSESKEIARLKGIIAKLKKGEDVEGDDAEEDEE